MMRKIEWVRRAPDEHIGDGVDLRRTILPPSPAEHDPVILWSEDWFRRGAFDMHAHRGFATVSYVASGEMTHASSLGEGGVLAPGDVLWTVAGRGLMHDGQPVGDGVVHGMQLWLNLPANHRYMEPVELEIPGSSAPEFQTQGFRGRVYAGTCNGATGKAPIVTPFTFVELRFTEGHLSLDLGADEAGIIYVLDGTLDVGGQAVGEGCGARFSQGTGALRLTSTKPGLALIAAGKPIRENIIIDGPFVMNTEDEIKQAYQDLETGAYGEMPA